MKKKNEKPKRNRRDKKLQVGRGCAKEIAYGKGDEGEYV
jgi:hypothetical protein